jgi:hypothetical protein
MVFSGYSGFLHDITEILFNPSKVISLIRSDFRCTETVKYYEIILHKRDLFSYKTTFFIAEVVAL